MTVEALRRDPLRPFLDARMAVANRLDPGIEPIVLDSSVPLNADELAADALYVSPGFEYLTDGVGRPARVRGVLRLVPPTGRVRHRTEQASAGSGGQHGGHIVAVSLGGFASGPNLFPQDSNFNVSAYARLEHGWRKALRVGVSVAVDIAVVGDAVAPELLVVTHWEDDEVWETVLLNEPNVQ